MVVYATFGVYTTMVVYANVAYTTKVNIYKRFKITVIFISKK